MKRKPTKGKQPTKTTAFVNELKSIEADLKTDDRVFDDRMDSLEDDNREYFENIDAEFERQKATYLPPKLLERFAKKGLTLRWTRYLLQGKVDRLSIQKAMRRQYTYVRPEDIKEFQKDMPSESVEFTQGDVILAGDLVLMACPTREVNRRKQINSNRAQDLEAMNDQRMKADGFAFKRKSQTQNLYRTGGSFGRDSME